MSDFKKNITNINKKDRDKYFQLPKDYQEYLDEKSKVDKSMEGSKIRLEEQLEVRKIYISLLEDYFDAMTEYDKNPSSNVLKSIVEQTKIKVDKHNTEIEIVAQKNIFVDTYIYYKEDFMKRYTNEGGEKKSIFN
jgi:hypothetical protein|tara:strand:+ start:114 stop:518 length:405 start_codon:yes stop_codon:yes gene_type:complete